jgi:hypothetical protein
VERTTEQAVEQAKYYKANEALFFAKETTELLQALAAKRLAQHSQAAGCASTHSHRAIVGSEASEGAGSPVCAFGEQQLDNWLVGGAHVQRSHVVLVASLHVSAALNEEHADVLIARARSLMQRGVAELVLRPHISTTLE